MCNAVTAPGDSFATLMGTAGDGNVASNLDPNHKLVVPGDPANSYLFFILKGVAASDGDPAYAEPDDIGYMPMSNATLCCQKIDALEPLDHGRRDERLTGDRVAMAHE